MKKFFGFIVLFVVGVTGGVYWMLYTASGNSFLKPLIEQYLNQKLPVKARLEEFSLSPLGIKLYVGKDTRIQAFGTLDLFKQTFDIDYDLNIARLEELEPLTHQKLRGSLKTKGSIKGDKRKIDIVGRANVADGSADYHLVVQELQAKSLQAQLHKAKLQKILYMLYQPHFADALVNGDVVLKNIDSEALSGRMRAKVYEGRVDRVVIAKEFGIKGAAIRFSFEDTSVIHQGIVTSDMQLLSNVVKLFSRGAKFYIHSAKVVAPYRVQIDDLRRLYFLTKQKMRGALKLQGEIIKDRALTVTLHSKTLGGKIDAKLVNNNLKATIKDIKVVKLTHMLYYPRIFDSSMDANLHYNLATKKGALQAQAYDGRILPNKMTFLLQQMANFDITREIYKVTELNSTINDKIIVSQLDMQSRLTHISANNARVDLAKELVDAKLQIDIKDMPIFVKIRGRLKNPKITIDAGKMLRARAKKEVKKQLQKRLKDKVPSQVKEILNLF